jgi:hypothetical protein
VRRYPSCGFHAWELVIDDVCQTTCVHSNILPPNGICKTAQHKQRFARFTLSVCLGTSLPPLFVFSSTVHLQRLLLLPRVTVANQSFCLITAHVTSNTTLVSTPTLPSAAPHANLCATMASFGRVLNLLDDRYLELQDVTGNVEPMPTLVPYHRYEQNVFVYRMDTHHNLFMGLIQEFTARMAQQTGKELWTWIVQWEVDSHGTSAPSPKKPRLNVEQPGAETDEQQRQRRAPIIDIFERQVLDPELINEEDMLRVLIDIVQVESCLVPNFIEFLYRWIDHYEGDGKALKAALKWEIPSLWDFEYHPLILPTDIKKKVEEQKAAQSESNGQSDGGGPYGQGSMSAKTSGGQDLAHGSPTEDMRQKPDLVALERQAEESERLQYREVKYGIQPPKFHRPLSSLINIPTESSKRVKYYAACFKSRQRALVLLLEAGISMQQISNYQKLQEAHPRDTSSDIPQILEDSQDEPRKEFGGLQFYHDDAKAAQDYYNLREKLQHQREKQKEIAISNKLAVEARLAATGGASDDSSGVPLIPPTPSYARRPDMAAIMLARIRAARGKREERINYIPTQLVGRLTSKLTESSKDRQLMYEHSRRGVSIPHNTHSYTPRLRNRMGSEYEEGMETEDDDEMEPEDEVESDGDSDSEESSDDDDDDDGASGNLLPPQIQLAPGHPGFYSAYPAGAQAPGPLNMGVAGTARGAPNAPTPIPTFMAEYMRTLTPEETGRLVPLLIPTTLQAMASNLEAHASSDHHVTTGATQQGQTFPPPPNMHMTRNIGALPYTGMASGLGQSRNASVHLPLPSSRPHTVVVPPGPHRPTLPFLPPRAHFQNHAAASAQGSDGLPQNHFPLHFQADGRPSVPSGPQPSSQYALPPGQGTQQESNGMGGFSRPQQVMMPIPSLPSLHLNASLPTPLPGASGQIAPINGLAPRHGYPGAHVPAPNMQSLSCMNSAVPRNPSNWLSSENSLALPPQQEAQGQIHTPLQSLQLAPTPPAGLLAHQAAGPGGSPLAAQQPSSSQLPLPRADLLNLIQQLSKPDALATLSRATTSAITTTQPQHQLPPPSSFSQVPSSINRNAPTPLTIPSAPSSPNPFASLGSQLLATTPFASSPNGVPIQIYFPRIVVPGNGIGPDGKHLGDNNAIETDAFLIGYTHPRSGKIVLSTAIFMPLGCWMNSLNRVRKGAYKVLEMYPALKKPRAHHAVYEKLAQAYGLMRSKKREEELTKRWRASQGPMTQRERGAVWEGWGVVLDRGIEMGKEDRKGAILKSWLVDEGVDEKKRGPEAERRWREIEELLEEEDWEEDWDDDEDEDMEM